MKAQKRLRQVLELSREFSLSKSTSVDDLERLERIFRDLVRCSCIEVEAMSFCKNFAWDKEGADSICKHLLGNAHRLIGDTRTVPWMQAIEDVQPWIEQYLVYLLEKRKYKIASVLCAWYAAIFPDSTVFWDALRLIRTQWRYDEMNCIQNNMEHAAKTLFFEDVSTLPISFVEPRSVYWSREKEAYLVSHDRTIEIFTEQWRSKGRFTSLRVTSPIAPALIETQDGLLWMGNLAPKAWKLDRETGEVLAHREYDFFVVSQPKPYGEGLFMARTSTDSKFGGPFRLTIFDDGLQVVRQYTVPMLEPWRPYSHFIWKDLIGVVQGGHEGMRIIFLDKESGRLVKIKNFSQCCNLAYNATVVENIVYVATGDGVLCLNAQLSVSSMKIFPFYLNQQVEAVNKRGETECFLTGHPTLLRHWRHVGSVTG